MVSNALPMKMLHAVITVGAPIVALALIASPLVADALRLEPVEDPVVAKECGACHMLYPAGLLPARSWRSLTSHLADHFGDNASLDDATTRRIADYLAAGAADAARGSRHPLRDVRSADTPERVTEAPWWKRKHERKDRVTEAALRRNGAKFKGDCKACHEDAERGWFDEPD